VGPILLFDKSFLQSLTVDESVWLDHCFLPVVTPLFYAETLADLEKDVDGRTPEMEVRIIADKFPDVNGSPCSFHLDIGLSNLHGNPIPMDGTVPRPSGRLVKVDGQTGVVWEESPEAKAFSRWQTQDFLSIERHFARQWRARLSSLRIEDILDTMRGLGIGDKLPKTLAEAKAVADAVVYCARQRTRLLELALRFVGTPTNQAEAILKLWKQSGYPSLHEYAPYAAFLLDVEVFFQVSLAAGIIAIERPSNRIDIAYLFYLPFCHVFVSSDKLHAKCASLFLRPDQEFVVGQQLKSDLGAVNRSYLEERGSDSQRDVWSFPDAPPAGVAPLISRLHGKYMRQRDEPCRPDARPADERELLERIDRMQQAPGLDPAEAHFYPSEPDAVVVEKRVRRRKGSWLQVPKDIS
jgi:hypothetical protein